MDGGTYNRGTTGKDGGNLLFLSGDDTDVSDSNAAQLVLGHGGSLPG